MRLQAFRAAFDAAFDQVDRHRGGHNFAPLVAVRARLRQFDTAEWCEGLRELRRLGLYGLSAASGRAPTKQEQPVCPFEHGQWLLYVSRKPQPLQFDADGWPCCGSWEEWDSHPARDLHFALVEV